MSLYGCGDPKCPQCNPASPYSLGSMPSWSSTGSIAIPYSYNIKQSIDEAYRLALKDLFESGTSKQNKEQPMSSSKTQQALEAVRAVDESELPRISAEVEEIKRKNKANIVQGLEGMASLELLNPAKIRHFVLAYYMDGKAKTLKGVELGDTSRIPENKESDEARVWVSGRDYPTSGSHYTVSCLRKRLDDSNIPFHIAYYKD